MITTVLRASWINFKRDRVAQIVNLILPILFFSIFATIFGGMAGGSGKMVVTVAVVDEDGTSSTQRLVSALGADPKLNVETTRNGEPLDAAAARALVAEGELTVAVVIPRGFSDRMRQGRDDAAITVLADTSDPVGPQMVSGLLQAAAFRALPDLWMQQGLDNFKRFGGELTEQQKEALDLYESSLALLDSEEAIEMDSSAEQGLVKVELEDVLRGDTAENPTIPYYAASTGVMFLLFMVSASGGSLLQEEENGVLERLLGSSLGMGKLLFGKWLFAALMGIVQVTSMFVWGSLVFGLDLWTVPHLTGFLVMVTVTASAASALGLFLATLCRTRAQLGGFSVILVLTMSALGGSMFPRFLMPEWMQTVGLFTFNAWALDGFQKVFWYNRPLFELWPQVSVLVGLSLLLMALARLFSRRWETI